MDYAIIALLVSTVLTLIANVLNYIERRKKQGDDKQLTKAQAEVADADAAEKVVHAWEALYERVMQRVSVLEQTSAELHKEAETLRGEVIELRIRNKSLLDRVGELESELKKLKNGGNHTAVPTV